MSIFQAEALLSANGYLQARENAPDWVNRALPPEPTPSLDFDWDPKGTLFAYTIGGVVFVTNSFRTATHTPIQFTPISFFPDSDRYPVEFHWDFGDGEEGWGEGVEHTYIIGNPHIRTTLRVRDNQGAFHFVSHQMYVTGDSADSINLNPVIVLEEA